MGERCRSVRRNHVRFFIGLTSARIHPYADFANGLVAVSFAKSDKKRQGYGLFPPHGRHHSHADCLTRVFLSSWREAID